jgi:ankyrin repeat protein
VRRFVTQFLLSTALVATGLSPAACNKSEEEFLSETKEFLTAGNDVNDFEWPGTRLHVAAKKGYVRVTELLLEHKADVNAAGYIGWFNSGRMVQFDGLTPLHEGADGGHVAIVRILLDHGADLNMGSITPLHAAVRKGYVEVVRLLLDRGARVNVTTEARSESVLHWAVGAGQIEAAEMLLNAGAAADARDESGFTPLHWAAFLADAEMAQLLLNHRADANASDLRRRTPLYWAAGDHRRQVAAVIARAGGELRLDQVLPLKRVPHMIPIN